LGKQQEESKKSAFRFLSPSPPLSEVSGQRSYNYTSSGFNDTDGNSEVLGWTKAGAYLHLGIVHKSPSFLQIKTVLKIPERQDSMERPRDGNRCIYFKQHATLALKATSSPLINAVQTRALKTEVFGGGFPYFSGKLCDCLFPVSPRGISVLRNGVCVCVCVCVCLGSSHPGSKPPLASPSLLALLL
jgi:hypothetical protein